VTDEARIEQTEEGAVVSSPGWFVLNLADTVWQSHERAGVWTDFEGGDFDQIGVGVHVLYPGQPNGRYHSETSQEDFLVLSGECILIVDGEERRLKQWDFFHASPGTYHIRIGAGDGPCAILMVGARRQENEIHYPRDEVAARHDASSPEDTHDSRVAYSDWSREFKRERSPWPV
jgi:uncharacterized cupin superfamily protein